MPWDFDEVRRKVREAQGPHVRRALAQVDVLEALYISVGPPQTEFDHLDDAIAQLESAEAALELIGPEIKGFGAAYIAREYGRRAARWIRRHNLQGDRDMHKHIPKARGQS